MKDVAAWLALTEEQRAKALDAKRRRVVKRMETHGIKRIHDAERPCASSVEPAPALQKRGHVEIVHMDKRRKA